MSDDYGSMGDLELIWHVRYAQHYGVEIPSALVDEVNSRDFIDSEKLGLAGVSSKTEESE